VNGSADHEYLTESIVDATQDEWITFVARNVVDRRPSIASNFKHFPVAFTVCAIPVVIRHLIMEDDQDAKKGGIDIPDVCDVEDEAADATLDLFAET
jgi:hypothetical protein